MGELLRGRLDFNSFDLHNGSVPLRGLFSVSLGDFLLT